MAQLLPLRQSNNEMDGRPPRRTSSSIIQIHDTHATASTTNPASDQETSDLRLQEIISEIFKSKIMPYYV
jgi:hypothetical protein